MREWAFAHPWMTFWLIVFLVLMIDSMIANVVKGWQTSTWAKRSGKKAKAEEVVP